MSIRPVDLQILVQKSNEVQKVQHHDAQKPDSGQQFAQQLQKQQVELSDQQIIQSNKSEHNVDKDGRNKNQYSGKHKKKSDSKDKENATQKSSSMLDVKI